MSVEAGQGRSADEPNAPEQALAMEEPALVEMAPGEGASTVSAPREVNANGTDHNEAVGQAGQVGQATYRIETSDDHAADDATVDRAWGATRRARFRDRPRNWWLLALTAHDAPSSADTAVPSRLGHPPESSAATSIAPVPSVENDVVDGAAVAGENPAGPTETRHEADDGPAPSVAATMPPGPARPRRSAPTRRKTRNAAQARQVRGLIAAALALVLLGIALSHLLAPSRPASPTPPVATAVPNPTSPAGLFAPVAAKPVTATAVLGGAAKLQAPHEAVLLPNGHFAVADTGNSRVVFLDDTGHLLRAVRRGAATLRQPFAIVALGSRVAVLDADRGSIDLFDDNGNFVREILVSPQLVDGRGMAVGPHDNLYVANPRTNSIVILSPDGKITRIFTGPLSAAPGQFNQPSDVSVGSDGTMYILDNVNNRIEAITPARSFIRQWPAPSSNTIFSVHVLALPNGRVVASDPAGALIVYPSGAGAPMRVPLLVGGQSATAAEPIGLADASHGNILVTDAQGGRLLVVSSQILL